MTDGFQRQWPALDVRAGALPFRLAADATPEILLIRRRGRDNWSIPKGRLMVFRSAHDSARIEAKEEAGVLGRVRREALGSYLHVKGAGTDGRRSEAVEVIVFLLEVEEVTASWREMDQRERQWVRPDEAAELVSSSHLRTIIASFASAWSPGMPLAAEA
jgi:8-oxo-dGTP pyrophosphatase MutT (NUDIX family)